MTEQRSLTVERSTSTAHRLMHYDGACNNVHGHNFDWEVELEMDVDINGEDNMGIDFKKVSDLIDDVDHATLLNESDPLLSLDEVAASFGEILTFNGDPTVELVAKWMAERIHEAKPAINHVTVTCYETEKYGLTAEYPEG